VRADPAAVLAALLAPPLRKVFDAADPALGDVTLLGVFLWESADPAADFAALLAVLLLRVFDAAVAAFLPVTSLLLMDPS